MPVNLNVDKQISVVSIVAPAAAKTTTTTPSSGVDLAGFASATVVVHVGAITDGTHTLSVEESDSASSGFATVAAGQLSGTPGALSASSVVEVGYLGTKRYIRPVITVTGSPATGGFYAATVVKSGPRTQPQ